ncbi:MAG: hypothetical protein HC898_11025, partial [Phycisphaerales bacterium]|nr:hypothetical protein [Phycisphaerales bacterium]
PPGMEVVNVYLDLMRHPLPLLPNPWNRTLAELLPPHRRLVSPLHRQVHLMFVDFIGAGLSFTLVAA